MPDDAASLTRVFTGEQPLDRQFYSAKLLVTPHNLDCLIFLVGSEERKAADDCKQVPPIQHSRHKPLLIVGGCGTMLQIVQCPWIWV
ncbi:MAG: hypothetical protein C5S49_07720 [Candidatus Methanogaster sp.]|nr:MAG: hypothetical protein C5S49_07720 [ANME-2 cluster archaeon]